MPRILGAAIACILLSPMPVSAITIDTVPVGDVGNNNDPRTGFGGVNYAYRIGTTEVTNAQYVGFLNAKAASDPLGLYNENMGSDARGGITRSGTNGSYTYAVKTNMGNKPVNFVSWYDAVRFANWLNNGQGNADTEIGAYTLTGGIPTPSNAFSIIRNVGASWFLPSENEWYKAAYYQPAALGGDTDNYWLYATRSNVEPTLATANNMGDISNPGDNVANYLSGADWNGQHGNVTTVGSAGRLSQSYYGTFDQGGNVWEWNDALIRQNLRGMRAGSYATNAINLQASSVNNTTGGPAIEVPHIGLRIATTIPEPSTVTLAALGALGLLVVARSRQGA